MYKPRPQTYRDLQKWLRTLTDAQLDTPILVTPGADDFGGTDYLAVVEMVTQADADPRTSGGYEGTVLIVAEQEKERQDGEQSMGKLNTRKDDHTMHDDTPRSILLFCNDEIIGKMPYPLNNGYFPWTWEGKMVPPVTIDGIQYEILGVREVLKRVQGKICVNVRRR